MDDKSKRKLDKRVKNVKEIEERLTTLIKIIK